MPPTSLLTVSRSRQAHPASQRDEAYRQIKELIITLQLQPASLLDEMQLSAQLGIGRTPIREALLQLQFENLIIILPRRGTIVADLNPGDLKKLFEIRVQLEPYAARLAAQRATRAEVSGLLEWSERTRAAIAHDDSFEMLKIDREGHQRIAAATHNEFLETTLDQLFGPTLRVSYWFAGQYRLATLPQQMEELRQVATAIERGDCASAEQLMLDHISVFQEELLTLH